MKEFKGSFEEIRQLIKGVDASGVWSDIEHGKQFKTPENGILNWFPATGKINYQGNVPSRLKLQKLLEGKGDQQTDGEVEISRVTATGKQNGKVFVVHGHDSVAREQLELVIHKLGLDPYVLANTSGEGLTIIEALESEIGGKDDSAKFGIVLMTPDDVGYAKKDGVAKAEPRARQNVVLEMGMLISSLKRSNVAILKKGHLETPSDADGILYIGFNEHIRETVPRLADRLNKAGFTISAAAITKAAS